IMDDAGTSGMFVTVYYTIFQRGGTMLGANAGHNQPLLYRHTQKQIEWLPRGGRALGWFDDLPVQVQTYQLHPGDMVIFYTDGITEAENMQGEQFGDARLAEVIQHEAEAASVEEVKASLVNALVQFVGEAPPFDDQTLVIVRYTGKD
ncbi:MAG: PP2C family protein-serine/threonine phosphatase, partial [Anaerolineales bacterium]